MKESQQEPLTYEQSGVRYDLVDPAKILAQQAALQTAANLAQHGLSEVSASRGESAYVVDVGAFYIASIVECLGTKILVADEMQRLTGALHYDAAAQDTIAMAVNDLITVGATPLAVQAYWAAGDSEWFADADRMRSLVQGWKRACDLCGVSWGGGETPALAGVVSAGRMDLAAACVGIIRPRERLCVGTRLSEDMAIVLLDSSGIHANGLSLARAVAQRLPQGYCTALPDGRSFGEALLVPTVLYSPVTEALHQRGVRLRYAVNITGHGWRKLLRHPDQWTYRIHSLPTVAPVLDFIVEHAAMDPRSAYSTLNMGAGFALFVDPVDVPKTIEAAAACGVVARLAGQVEKGPKRLIIEPLGLCFEADSLSLR